MKKQLNQSITIFMAFLILLSSTGFAFIEHQCMMRGKSVQFVLETKNESCDTKVVYSCCAKSAALKKAKGTYLTTTGCCKENQKFEKLDVLSSSKKVLAKSLKAVADNALWTARSVTSILIQWILPALVQSQSLSFSSLFHGRGMLSFVQSFLI